jgi:hypothetical protein
MFFSLCKAPSTFQRCIMNIFSYYIQRIIEIYMNDFTVYGTFLCMSRKLKSYFEKMHEN